MKDYLKERFDAREELGCKADPEQVAIHMRNARNKDNGRLFSREEWLSRNQIQAYFSRLFVLKKKQDSTSMSPQVVRDDMNDVVEEEEWLQQVDEVYENIGGFRGRAEGAAPFFFLYFQNVFVRPQPF